MPRARIGCGVFLHFMATQAQEHRDAAINRHTQRNTILVVDDDLEIRSLLKILLEKTGYTVATAADGQEGLSFFVQHQSSIALLLTDVMMANMNGIDWRIASWSLVSFQQACVTAVSVSS